MIVFILVQSKGSWAGYFLTLTRIMHLLCQQFKSLNTEPLDFKFWGQIRINHLHDSNVVRYVDIKNAFIRNFPIFLKAYLFCLWRLLLTNWWDKPSSGCIKRMSSTDQNNDFSDDLPHSVCLWKDMQICYAQALHCFQSIGKLVKRVIKMKA